MFIFRPKPRSYFIPLLIMLSIGYSVCFSGEEIDTDINMLKAIIESHLENRSKVSDLILSGTIKSKEDADNKNILNTDLNFQYHELGNKKRLDRIYINGGLFSDRLCFNGSKTLTCPQENMSGTITAHVFPSDKVSTSEISYLYSLRKTAAWDSNIGQIQFILNRGLQVEKDSLKCKRIVEKDKLILRVIYESTRGGYYKCVWDFDPRKGYEIVSAESYGESPDKSIVRKESASYIITEIATSVWRPLGVDYHAEDKTGDKINNFELEIHPEKFTVNTGSVTEETFTFKGMGLHSGTLVEDHSKGTSLVFEYDQPSLPEYEKALSKHFVDSNEIIPEIRQTANQLTDSNTMATRDTIKNNPYDEQGQFRAYPRYINFFLLFIIGGTLSVLFYKKKL